MQQEQGERGRREDGRKKGWERVGGGKDAPGGGEGEAEECSPARDPPNSPGPVCVCVCACVRASG